MVYLPPKPDLDEINKRLTAGLDTRPIRDRELQITSTNADVIETPGTAASEREPSRNSDILLVAWISMRSSVGTAVQAGSAGSMRSRLAARWWLPRFSRRPEVGVRLKRLRYQAEGREAGVAEQVRDVGCSRK